jgi:hypothetical protein
VRVFNTACDSALITSVVSEWRPYSFILNQGREKGKRGRGITVMLFLLKNSLVKKEV